MFVTTPIASFAQVVRVRSHDHWTNAFGGGGGGGT